MKTSLLFGNRGQKLDHFYCYNKPVVAPADGYVYDIINHVEDNEINTVNVDENWGNSIIINHLNGLYTQISHIKKDSFTVAIGDYIKKGLLVATCGNSVVHPNPIFTSKINIILSLGQNSSATSFLFHRTPFDYNGIKNQ